jgi:hypothetical protein
LPAGADVVAVLVPASVAVVGGVALVAVGLAGGVSGLHPARRVSDAPKAIKKKRNFFKFYPPELFLFAT